MRKPKPVSMMLVLAATASCAAGLAAAQEAKPVHDLSFNAALVSDYRYRGISQTRLDPALQGGVDYSHTPSGWYAGTWLSTIRWIRDTPGAGSSPAEWDLYGGKKGELGHDISYDVGLLNYIYVNNRLGDVPGSANANTSEVYGQLGYGPAYVKYSHSLTNLFGFADSKGSGYLDVGANVDMTQGWMLNLHAGHQRVRNNGAFSYTDWKLGVSKDFGVVTGSLAWVGTDTSSYRGPDGSNLGKNGLVLAVSKTF